MKECPVCKESFQDDLNFCDLDGSPLDGRAGSTVEGSSSKLWSFLGIALLLAAVGITAGAIIFFPRGPSATSPTVGSQTGPTSVATGSSSTVSDSARAQSDGNTATLDRSGAKPAVPDAAESTSPDQARLASRKAALSKNENADSSLPNPKSVIGSDDELTRPSAQPVDETRPRTSKPASSAVDNGSGTRAASDSSGSDSAARSAAAKRRSKSQAQGDDAESNGSKKDDKKKGGFLRVFKKIFGHG